jgi:hypothetical protein
VRIRPPLTCDSAPSQRRRHAVALADFARSGNR